MAQDAYQDHSRTWNMMLPIMVGFLALAVLVLGVGYWSVKTEISGAVVSTGIVEVQTNKQVVQHPKGGVVGEILVRDGDVVSAGQTLLKLDDTFISSELAVVERQLFELWAAKSRLEAERDGAEALPVTEKLKSFTDNSDLFQSVLDSQKKLFFTREESLVRETKQLQEQISQIENQISGTRSQLSALSSQSKIVNRQLEKQKALLEDNLTQESQVLALQREEASITGETGRLTSEEARLEGQIATIQIEIQRLRTKRQEEAMTELRNLGFREIELVERRIALLEELSRLSIHAPVSGTVYGSRVFALKSVVEPAQPMMYVIPRDTPLVIAAKIEAIHIDQIYADQPATLRFTSFNDRQTPEIEGKVVNISADAFSDELTGQSYYRAELLPAKGQIDRLNGQVVLPGMPVETMIRTDARTPLSFLLKPLTDYFSRALRG